MKNRKLFDFGLYREGIKQLKTPGIVFFVIFMIAAVAVPLTEVIDRGYSIEIVTGMDMHPVLLGLCIVAFILTLYLFGFLNKRNTADFYHAMPYTRECVFLSFYASVLTWLFIIAAATSLVSFGLHSIFSGHFTVVFSSWLMYTLNCLAAAFLAAACTAIACAITGTTINGIIVAVLIMFLPRFIIAMITYEITLLLPMMSYTHIGFLLEGKYNLLTYLLFESLGIFNWFNDILADPAAFIYTIVLSLAYAAAACCLFKKRKSETAGQSSPNRIMQAVYRITVTMMICIIVLCLILDVSTFESDEVFLIIFGYFIAVFVYFLYELITTKKWKNLLKAVPALGIVAVLNGLIYCGMLGIYQAHLNFTPTADEITSVSLQLEEMPRFSLENYYKYQSSDIKLTDERVKQIVAKNLKENVDALKATRSKNASDTYYKYSNARNYESCSIVDDDFASAQYIRACVKIRTKSGAYYRKVVFPSADFKIIIDSLISNPEFQKRALTLPEPVKNPITFGYSNEKHTDKAAYEVFKAIQDELASVDADVWLSQLKSYHSPAHISYRTVINNNEIYISVPILPNLTPKSYEKFFEYTYNTGRSDRERILSLLKSEDYKKYNVTAEIVLNQPNGTFVQVRIDLNDETIPFLLDNLVDERIGPNDSYIYIEIRYGAHDIYIEGADHFVGYFKLSNLTYEDIINKIIVDNMMDAKEY